MMKKFLLKVSIFAASAILFSAVICVWIDPFNVFHANNIRFQGVDSNNNYVKMKYLLSHPERFDSFIFGSSRVGAIHTENITGERCYNMTLSTGLPGWHLLNIKTMLKNGVHPRKIYIGVDTVSYTGDYEKQYNDPVRCPYEYLTGSIINSAHFATLYFDIAYVRQTLGNLLLAWKGKEETLRSANIFYKYGWNIPYGQESKFDWNDKRRVIPSYGGNKNKHDIETILKIIRETSEICRENNTELILFTNPMHRITYLASVRDKDYFKFLEGLAEISDFWNFSSLNDITTNNANYIETSHYHAEVGDILINVMCSGKSYPELNTQGFGVKVTRENAKDFISMLRRQIEDYEKSQQ